MISVAGAPVFGSKIEGDYRHATYRALPGALTRQIADASELRRVCKTIQTVPVFANTGVTIVDGARVRRFMDVVGSLR